MEETTWKKLLQLREKTKALDFQSFPVEEFSSDAEAEEYLRVIGSRSEADAKPVIFAHLAQSLDARIACQSGDSKWIGNQGNLIHAHRMRALCDCIMVGKQTWEYDSPQLNVRHVEGENPVKLIIEGHSINKNNYPKTYYFDDGEPTTSEWESPSELLKTVFHKGIKTIFLEGGGKTVSFFLMNKLVDYLQLHISPLVMGSGINSILLPEINTLDQAINFENPRFIPIEDHIMFSGKVIYK